MNAPSDQLRRLFAHHPRRWQDFRYVYPVISRRSKGLSIGINLNPEGACNFDCRYCCVDRAALEHDAAAREPVDLSALREELDQMLGLAARGELWNSPPLDQTPPQYRVLRDIAFSGDGEPTAYRRFDQACQVVADLKRRHDLPRTRIVLITNATLLTRPAVMQGLETLYANDGEIWAKLDAGTERYYRMINRCGISLRQIVQNILSAGQRRPLVVQSMFVQFRGRGMSDAELTSYIRRLKRLIKHGCQIRLVQLYTIARRTADEHVQPVPAAQMEAMAQRVREAIQPVPVEVFHTPQAADAS